MHPYEYLANAIVEMAAKDYRKTIRVLKKNPKGKKAMVLAMDCEDFFKSAWFSTLTELDGEWLMNKLRKEAIDDGKGVS